MSYNINYTDEFEYVKAVINGKWPENSAEMHKSILASCKGHAIPKLLIDVEGLEDNPTPLQDFNTIKLMQKLGYEKIHKIAVYDKLKNKNANDIFEGLAFNTNLKMRFFYNEQDALNFLLNK
ncbi:MAG: hypothetical protein KJN64_09305 [Ignavibacteria bacterium]|nr:hypothetical protein [Ignavibacteria bacterium]MBT8391073.1 hypothetical protein [Ignavibacteria bacterium]NNJ54452.1 hypothetical protein [Ignavibacteriaceae bacterium]NNL21859.1 hypothetical protein [Ignavibacteriaceae bacterium]